MLGGGNNYAGYQNPEFDKLVDEATAETDTTKRNEIFRQCYEMIKEDVPAIMEELEKLGLPCGVVGEILPKQEKAVIIE